MAQAQCSGMLYEADGAGPAPVRTRGSLPRLDDLCRAWGALAASCASGRAEDVCVGAELEDLDGGVGVTPEAE